MEHLHDLHEGLQKLDRWSAALRIHRHSEESTHRIADKLSGVALKISSEFQRAYSEWTIEQRWEFHQADFEPHEKPKRRSAILEENAAQLEPFDRNSRVELMEQSGKMVQLTRQRPLNVNEVLLETATLRTRIIALIDTLNNIRIPDVPHVYELTHHVE